MSSAEAAAWVSGLGTIILALVAVSQEWIRELIWRPRLRLDVSTDPPCSHRNVYKKNTDEGPINIPGYYFRVRISNTGSRAARKVEVYATRLSKRTDGGRFETQSEFEPLNLAWSHVEEDVLEILLPKMSKYCGLGRIYDPAQRNHFPLEAEKESADPGKTLFGLAAKVIPFTGTTFLSPGIYRLSFQVAAENVDPQAYTIEINHTGDWFREESRMLGEGVGLTIVE